MYLYLKLQVFYVKNGILYIIYHLHVSCMLVFFILQQAELMNSRLAGLKPGLFECQNPIEWKRIRQITSSAFTNLKLKAVCSNVIKFAVTGDSRRMRRIRLLQTFIIRS